MSYNLVESCHVYVTFLFAVYEYYLYYHVFLETSRTVFFFFFLMIRRPPRSTLSSSSAASDVYKRQHKNLVFIPTPIKGHFFVLRGTRRRHSASREKRVFPIHFKNITPRKYSSTPFLLRKYYLFFS
eukprot:TRINITY_DN544_c0_g1_i1.p1 TRINITY_DN544_c0_g1~~TRINITY_DN544_c0_g1_i1.p1  ORF type:complete len:127 (-),score=8.06 TRINITY_DN544_c0_g1_i1:460-840(-)